MKQVENLPSDFEAADIGKDYYLNHVPNERGLPKTTARQSLDNSRALSHTLGVETFLWTKDEEIVQHWSRGDCHNYPLNDYDT